MRWIKISEIVSKYRNILPLIILWYIIIFSLVTLIFSAIFTYKNAKLATEDALKMQAMGIAITIQSFLQSEWGDIADLDYGMFSDLILNEKWEEIAFVSLYNLDGYVILHSNPSLIGTKIQLPKVKDYPYYSYLTLKTSERVFIGDFKIFVDNPYILRVALHTYSVKKIIQRAQIYATIKLVISLSLIFLGFLGTALLRKVQIMQLKLKELENISLMTKILAHEIRNPLGSIKGFSQYLINKIGDDLQIPLKIILRESLRIERLTDELILYSNPVKLIFTEISLKELLEEILLSFQRDYNDINFQFFLNEDIKLISDRDKLKEIIVNIIQNAIDAVYESSKVEKLIILKMEKKQKEVKFEIIDNGIGMDEEVLSKAINPFFTTKSKGSGLGLAIVNKFCEALNIRLEIKSKKGEGTKVCLTIPKLS